MRLVVKHIASFLGFTAGLLVLLILASHIVLPKNNSKEGGIRDYRANGILGEPENSIDVLFLGDSEGQSAISPLEIWRTSGITSYVCCTPAQHLYYSEEFLRQAFTRQTPKIVVLETNAIFRNFSYGNAVTHRADTWFPVFRYHNRWKSLSKSDFSSTIRYTHNEIAKGYYYNKSINAAAPKNHMKYSDQTVKIPAKNRLYVKEIQRFCKENGARLILLSTPSTKNWNYARHNTIQKLADDLAIEYIDMNLLQKQIPIDWKRDTRDKGDHLNYAGAVKVAHYLSGYLTDTTLFTDRRRDAAFAAWNSALKQFDDSISTNSSTKKV